jgi:DNA polymerase III delta prime subunit
MIKMIPDFISENIKSNAERKIFSIFKNSFSNENISILHSLGIAEHTDNIFGEIDFVVICSFGIICIEVKGGVIQRKDGIWYFTNRYGKTDSKNIGPFQQVQNNMHSLRQFLIKKLGNNSFVSNTLFSSCVIMPDCTFNKDGTDIIQQIMFDMNKDMTLQKIISESSMYWKNKIQEKHRINFKDLSVSEINLLTNLLRGDFKIVPSMHKVMDETERELLLLTDEQYKLLENINDNDRLLISGMAGTGKTLLALEQSRRLYWSGKKVLFLCFNRSLSEYVKTIFVHDLSEIGVSTFHSYLMNCCDINWSEELNDYFYSQELPEFFMSKEINHKDKYDVIIIDEGQDLFRDNYFQCIDKLLVNGLQNGCWNIYFDPNQNIYIQDKQIEEMISALKKYSAFYKLSINCRNTRQIVNANILTSNISQTQIYKANGIDVKYIPYNDLSEEFILVRDNLYKLKNEGINNNEIVLLSEYKVDNPKNCLSKGVFPNVIGKLIPDRYFWLIKKNEICFSTIHSFKGFEAKVIFLLDVDSFKEIEKRLLNYVAISRAQTCLFIFYNKSKENERQEMLQKGFPLLK